MLLLAIDEMWFVVTVVLGWIRRMRHIPKAHSFFFFFEICDAMCADPFAGASIQTKEFVFYCLEQSAVCSARNIFSNLSSAQQLPVTQLFIEPTKSYSKTFVPNILKREFKNIMR